MYRIMTFDIALILLWRLGVRVVLPYYNLIKKRVYIHGPTASSYTKTDSRRRLHSGLYRCEPDLSLFLTFHMILTGLLAFVVLAVAMDGAAAAVVTMIYFSLMFINDMLFPVEMLLGWLKPLIPYLPAYPAIQLVRLAMLDSTLEPGWMTHLLLLTAARVGASRKVVPLGAKGVITE
jgi:hypothetical protein